jgi:hypothetical protein
MPADGATEGRGPPDLAQRTRPRPSVVAQLQRWRPGVPGQKGLANLPAGANSVLRAISWKTWILYSRQKSLTASYQPVDRLN